MSDVSQGAGWWQASDGKWYPPEARSASEAAGADEAAPAPSAQPVGTPAAAAEVPRDIGGQSEQPGDAAGSGPASPPDAPAQSTMVRNPTLVTLAIFVLVAAVVGGIVYAVIRGVSSSTNTVQSVASATLADLNSGTYNQICTLSAPDQTAKCTSDLKQLTIQHVKYTNLSLGTVTTSGPRAVFVIVGRVCVGARGRCLSNENKNVGKGHTFDQLYASAIGTTNSSPFLLPEIRQNGHWYVTGF